MKKYNLQSSKPKRFNLSKPKRYKLINPEILNIIENSEFYDSSFDDPSQKGMNIENLVYRLTQEQKDKWIEGIINNDPRIFRIKQKKNFVILVCINKSLGNNGNKNIYRYISFVDERKGDNNGYEKEEVTTIKKKKDRLYNVQNKSRVKRKGIRKVRRK